MDKYLKNYMVKILCFFLSFYILGAKAENDSLKVISNKDIYKKLHGTQNVEKAKGKFVSLYKMDSKIYVELPLKFLNKEMLFGSTISSVSDPSFMTIGMKNANPLHIKLERRENSIVIKKINQDIYYAPKDEKLSHVMQLNYDNPTLASFKIESFSPDSSAVYFNMTSFFARPNPLLPLIGKYMGGFLINSTPNSSMSFIKTIKAFDNNASIKVEFNYTLSASIMGIVSIYQDMPMSIEVTNTLLLLPERKMMPRILDKRIGIFSTPKMVHNTSDNAIEPIAFAHRWKLIPKDTIAFQRGILVEPQKQIVFYVDNTFPDEWKDPIKKGVLRWNKAFEKIGLKNVILVKDFPENDKAFDADNLQYSCIRYIPNDIENAMGPSWVDPSTGEIINASVFIHNNIIQLLHKWRFIQTASVDARVRGITLPKEVFDESLSYAVAHEVGHTLGLTHNMAASAAFPVDSLRSASFTKKHGTTPSIMDYARFNYIAQPTDTNVCLCPPELGK